MGDLVKTTKSKESISKDRHKEKDILCLWIDLPDNAIGRPTIPKVT